MTTSSFDRQIGATLEFEGGYVNDPDDPGGETNLGISKRSYPDLNIAKLTRNQAVAIYLRDYFKVPGFDKLPDSIGGKVFDLGVNMGPRTAVKLLQRAINHGSGTLAVVVDGKLGPLTLRACDLVPGEALLARLRIEATHHYQEIAAANPVMRKYLRGWLRRAQA